MLRYSFWWMPVYILPLPVKATQDLSLMPLHSKRTAMLDFWVQKYYLCNWPMDTGAYIHGEAYIFGFQWTLVIWWAYIGGLKIGGLRYKQKPILIKNLINLFYKRVNKLSQISPLHPSRFLKRTCQPLTQKNLEVSWNILEFDPRSMEIMHVLTKMNGLLNCG